MLIRSPQSNGFGTTDYNIPYLKVTAVRKRGLTHRREIINEGDLGLCHVTHIGSTNLKGTFPPAVNLA